MPTLSKGSLKPLSSAHLEVYLIDPDSPTNVTQNEFFNFTAGVRCVGGDCGNVTATLDPKKSKNKGYPIFTETKGGFKLHYAFEKPVIGKNGEYNTITIPGLKKYGCPGMPVLPFKTVRILIPHGKEIKNIDVIPGKKVFLGKGFNIEPGQEPYPLSFKGSLKPTPPDPRVYNSMREFPGVLRSRDFSIQEMRGYRVLILSIYPVQYTPGNGELSYLEEMTVVIKLKSIVHLAARKKRFTGFRGLAKDRARIMDLVDNPQKVSTYDVQEVKRGTKSTSIVNASESYDYVIITNNALNSSSGNYTFQDLVNWKNKKGVKATIVTVEQIMADSDYDCDGTFGDGCSISGFNDTAAHIRNFIRDAYQNWGVTYVLLGGDGDGADVGGESEDAIIPHRGFYVSIPSQWVTDYDVPSDNYYACLNGSWNSNNDSKWGEPGEDDLLAEVFVGRAAVDSADEVSNFVMKTLAYESSSDDYLRNASMVGEDLGWYMGYAKRFKEEIREGSTAYGYNTTGFPANYNVSTLYDKDSVWSKSQLINIMNNGVHIINHLGHANVNYVMKMYNSDVDNSLTNDRYFFAYSQGCYSGSFDNRGTGSSDYKTYDSIAEHLTTKPHGAFAVIMNSRYGWGIDSSSTDGPSQHYDREFFDALFGEDKLHLGEANQDSKEDNIDFFASYPSCSGSDWPCSEVMRWCYYETTLFGDPETSIHIPGKGKGTIPVNTSSEPFYTISNNPYNANNLACLQNMGNGDECNQTWIVNATGASGTWKFYVIYKSNSPTVRTTETERINITIVDKTEPVISNVQNISITHNSGKIKWDTDDGSNSTIYYGTSPSVLNLTAGDSSFVTAHEVTLTSLDSYTTYYYNVSSCNLDGYCSTSGVYNFTTDPMPISITQFACNNGGGWTDCANIGYGDNLTQVRVNCTSKDGYIVNATFTLVNVPDSKTFFTGNATNSSEYWVYNNNDLIIGDSGLWNLSVLCKDNLSQEKEDSETWTVPWGHLEPYLIDPTFDKYVIQHEFFNFSSGVKCVGGECGNASATLDPINYTNETTSYSWIDITGTGTDTGITGDDDDALIDIGFTFTLFNSTHSQVRISSNGYMTFGIEGTDWSNDDIPSINDPDDYIAPFWDDLDPSMGGTIYYEVQGTEPNRMFIVEWHGIPHYYTIGDITFEAILYEGSNEIKFQYKDVDFGDSNYDNGASATVGLENEDGTDGVKFSYNSPSIYNGLAILFGTEGKGVIPMNSGTPFYTTDQNPMYSSNLTCLQNMSDGDECNQTWQVNATGEHLSKWGFYTIYSATTYDSYIDSNQTGILDITIIGAPTIYQIQCEENGSNWVNCSDIAYNDNLTRVRVNCTDPKGNVQNASFKLMNIPDNKVFFEGTTTTENTGWWVYNSSDTLIRDSGLWNLLVSCTNDKGDVGNGSESWTVAWGYLEPYMIDPASDKNVLKNVFFNFSSGVKCVGGECGNLSATLSHPTNMSFEDDMESGVGGWTYDGLWHLTIDLSHSSSHSWWYANESTGDYDTGARNYGSLITPLVGLSDAKNATLTFWYWYETESTGTSWDQRWVYIKVGENPWQQLEQLSGDTMNTWHLKTINLSSFVNNTIRIKFYFDTIDGTLNSYGGWYIDDIQVIGRGGEITPKNDGVPFYTTSDNPQVCTDMGNGDECNQTWQVNASGTLNSSKEFYTLYSTITYASYITNNKTGTINLTIVPDIVAPTKPEILLPSPQNNLITSNTSFTFKWKVTDDLTDTLTCDLIMNGVVNQSIPSQNNTATNYTLNFSDGSYTWNITCYDGAGNSNTSDTRTFEVDTTPPGIVHSITPKIVINGTNVSIVVNVSDAHTDKNWTVITLPNSTDVGIDLPKNYTANLIGRHNVTFFANDSAGNEVNVTDYFISAKGMQFNSSSVDYNNSGLNVTLKAYFDGNLITWNQSIGNVVLTIANYTYDLEFSTFNNSLIVLLRGVNLSENNDRAIGFDRLIPSEYLVTYAINNSYGIENATLNLSYSGTNYTDENYLGVYKCSNWNFSGRSCVGSWEKVTDASNDIATERFLLNVSNFSAFAIKQEPYCGDGVINKAGEECDGSEFGGETCTSYGYDYGSLSCINCKISTSGCKYSGGGGSGGGGGHGGGGYGAKPKPSCFDGIHNCHDGLCEMGVDCGGPCDPCMSCSDGIQNQGETGIDCGGPCPPCPVTTIAVTTTSTTIIKQTTTTTTPTVTVTSTIPATTTTMPPVFKGIDTNLFAIVFAEIFLIFVLYFIYTRYSRGEGDEDMRDLKDEIEGSV